MESWLAQIAGYLLAQSWQIAILTVAIAAMVFLLRNRSAHIRYLFWLIVLAKCLVPPVHRLPLPVLPPERPAASRMTPGLPPAPPLETGAASSSVEPIPRGRIETETASTWQVQEGPTPWSVWDWLGLGWLVGAVGLLILYLLKTLRMELWLRNQRKPLSRELRDGLESLAATHGLRGLPPIWQVEGIGQPFVWGLLRGSIYLPSAFGRETEPKRSGSLLGHELSHIVRYDAFVNILQVLAQVVFWFHPLVWWANAKIRSEREKCCDEATIARMHCLPEDYSTAIVDSLAAQVEAVRPVSSLAIAGPAKNVEERIRAMLKPGRQFHRRPSLTAVAIVVTIALLAVPTTVALCAKTEAQPETRSADKPAADGWGYQPRYAARTFNSQMAFRVWVMANYSGTRVVGLTPSASPLEIPSCWSWGVYTRSPVKDWDLLAREISRNEIPGLSLDPCTDSDLKHLADLRDLRLLGLEGTAITDAGLESLKGLTELEDLRLTNTAVTDAGLAHLKGLTKLRVLYLGKTRITDAGLQHLEGLTHLWGLVLNGTQITDAGLQHLTSLKELGWVHAHSTVITAQGVAQLKALPRDLYVGLDRDNSTITDSDLANRVEADPQMRSLNLDGSPITDAGLAHIRRLTGLDHLYLNGTKITDAGLANLESLTELQYLTLRGARITDAGLEHLKSLPKLWGLGLEGTQITDAGLQHLQGLKELRWLYLNYTRIGDAGLEHLQGLTKLSDLYLVGTGVTDAGLKHLRGLTSLRDLSLLETQVTEAGARQLKESLPNLTIYRDPPQPAAADANQPAGARVPSSVKLTGGMELQAAENTADPAHARIKFIDSSLRISYPESCTTGQIFLSNADNPQGKSPAIPSLGVGRGENRMLHYLYCASKDHLPTDTRCERRDAHADCYYCLMIYGGKMQESGAVVFPAGSKWQINKKTTGLTVARGTLSLPVTYQAIR